MRVSKVARNRLEFSWDPVQSVCPDVEYKVTAENCGVCPRSTNNTSITCILDGFTATIDKVCLLSIQTAVCGVTEGNRSRSTVTVGVSLKGK